MSDGVPIELSEQLKILQSPITFRECETGEEVANYFVETMEDIAKKSTNYLKRTFTVTFYSILSESIIDDHDYEHTKNVRRHFEE